MVNFHQGNERLLKIGRDALVNAFNGYSTQFMFNVDAYLQSDPALKKHFADDMRIRLGNYANLYGWKSKTVEEDINGLSEDYLAILGTLETHVFVGVDLEKDGFPTALYTRNPEILAQLNASGRLVTDPEKLIKNLFGTKLELSCGNQNFVLARLDIAGNSNGVVSYKAVIPRENMEIGLDKRFVFIPVGLYGIFEELITQAKDYPLEVTYGIDDTKLLRKLVTVSPQVTSKVYANLDDALLQSRLRKTPSMGYNVDAQCFTAFDLEASLHAGGTNSFRPELMHTLKVVGFESIDTSMHMIDFVLLRGIYRTRANGAKVGQLDALKFIDLSSYATQKDKAEALIALEETLRNSELYALMKSNEDFFGDINKTLEARERVKPKFLKNFALIHLPEVLDATAVGKIKELMSNGVLKLTAKRKNGTYYERVVSNNEQVLQRMVGKDYVRDFETVRTKLKYVQSEVMAGRIKTKNQLEKAGVDYNILEYVDGAVYFADDKQDTIDAITEGLENLTESNKGGSKSDTCVVFRNIHAKDKSDFFGSVELKDLVSIEYSQV